MPIFKAKNAKSACLCGFGKCENKNKVETMRDVTGPLPTRLAIATLEFGSEM